jgi:AraC family transcriptional regulator of adaptative response/methylated-DNA-[protein]-cysteine methyltransferase
MRTEPITIDEMAAWHAVQARDARFDGAFVYGVRSTGVYCRPSCPSRRPRRDRVAFFASGETAERGGFRACRRCRPGAAPAPDPRADLVLRACREMDESDAPLALDALAARLGVEAHHLHRTFKQIMGVTPRRYAAARRLETFKALVRAGEPVAGAMYEAGYGSSSRLYEKASEHLGMTPAAYRRGGRGMRVEFATVASPFGRLLVAATERGVCAVSFGDDDAALERALAEEYPAAEVRPGGERVEAWVEQILAHLDGQRPHLDLPLDLQATAFQLRVWEELRRIPYGATRSYAEVAAAVGRPTATRAVARACATNPVAVVTPCHRVVRADGGAGGYRWGVGRKRDLLARERAIGDATSPSSTRS